MLRTKKFIIAFVTAGLLVLAILIAVGFYVVKTPHGTQWLFQQASSFLPDNLKMSGIKGSIWQGVQISEISFSADSFRVEVKQLFVSVDWSQLTSRHLAIQNLNSTQINYFILKDEADSPQAKEPLTIDLATTPLRHLPLKISINESQLELLKIIQTQSTTEISHIHVASLRLGNQNLKLNTVTLQVQSAVIEVSEFLIQFEKELPIQGTINWYLTDNTLSGKAIATGSLAQLELEHHLAGSYPAITSGYIALLNRNEPFFDLTTNWQTWNIQNYQINKGHARVKGEVEQYTLTAKAFIDTPDHENITISAIADGHSSGFKQATIKIDSRILAGEVNGVLDWAPTLKAKASILLTKADPSYFSEHVYGNIAGTARINVDGEQRITLPVISMSGKLNDTPITLHGAAKITPDHMQCYQCKLLIGKNILSVDGSYSNSRSNIKLHIDAPFLSKVWPGLAGQLIGDAHLQGSLSTPQLNAKFQGTNLRYLDTGVEQLVLHSNMSNLQNIELTLKADSISLSENGIGSIAVNAKGDVKNFLVNTNWHYEDKSFRAQAALERTDQQLQGTLKEATFVIPETEDWYLSAPTKFQISPSQSFLNPHRWATNNSFLEVERLNYSENAFHIDARLQAFPLSAANLFLPAGYKLQGKANANVNLARQLGGWLGEFHWHQIGTVLNVEKTLSDQTDISIPKVEFNVIFANNGANGNLVAKVDPAASISLNAKINRFDRTGLVDGRLQLQGDEWGWLPAIVPVLDDVQGSLAGNVQFAGPLTDPSFQGSLTLQNGKTYISPLNIHVEDLDLKLAGSPDGKVKLTGSARSGEGKISIQGNVKNLGKPDTSLSLSVANTPTEIINWPEYRAIAASDLTFNASRSDFDIGGTIKLPRAEIKIKQIPQSAVTPSHDVIIKGEEKQSQESLPYSAKISVAIGDRVRIQAFGLDTHVSGTLLANKTKQSTLKLEGQLSLSKGKFTAFGQDLSIESGILTFTGPPDRPLIDVRAVRRIKQNDRDINVGVHIYGYEDSLSTTIYSDPTMSEADALSYLLTGGPLSQLTSSQGGELSNAAIGLGLSGAVRITQEIAHRFGIDELAVVGSGDQTALLAGKDISQRLYARYTFGVFSQIGSLFLGYHINENIKIEAETGDRQTIELIYSVERP